MPDALLRLHVTVRSSKNEITGWRGDALCVRTTAPPVEGAANAAVMKFIAKALKVRKSQIQLVSGKTSRDKTLKVLGLSNDDIRARFK